MTDKCVCGRELRKECPQCMQFVKVVDGKYLSHEAGHCTGSCLQYKNCPQSGKAVVD